MNNPKYVKVGEKLYPINTDFRVAIECNQLAIDKTIGEYERALAFIYKLFGEDGLNCPEMQKLLDLGVKYISISLNDKNEPKSDLKNDFDLDFKKCEGLIRSSFKFDYNYDPYELEYLHWYDFYNDLQNLSTSEFGNCCILNRILSILNQDPSKIKDTKDRTKVVEAQKKLKEKYCIKKEVETTKEQEESSRAFYKSLGINI